MTNPCQARRSRSTVRQLLLIPYPHPYLVFATPLTICPAIDRDLSADTGYLLDGTKFDSSYDRNEPFKFRLGKGKVITGWEGILPGMTVGQRVIVRVPPEFAYGEKSVGKIPANSPLLFYMELLELGNIK